MSSKKLWIGGIQAQIGTDTEVALSNSVTDLSNPENRTSGYTLQVLLPMCPRNNEIMHNLFDLEVDPNDVPAYRSQLLLPNDFTAQSFNRNAKNFGRIEVNGYEVINGLVSLDNISEKGYEVIFSSGGFLWANTFQNKLSAIQNLPTYCHDIATISTWNVNADNADMVFPLIDYGNFSDVLFNYSINPVTGNLPDVTDFFPAAFILALLRKAFADAGYTLSIGENLGLETLILPFVNNALVPLDETLLEDTDMVVGEGDAIAPTTSFTGLTLASTSVNILGQWKIISGIIEGFEVAINTSICSSAKKLAYEAFLKFDATNGNPFGGINIAVNPFINGVAQPTTIFTVPASSTTSFTFIQNFDLAQGDILTFDFDAGGALYQVDNIQLAINRIAISIGDSEYIRFPLAKQLPDITQFELLSNLLVMQNLYMQSNEQTKNVHLETRDVFLYSPTSDLIPPAAYPTIPAGSDTAYPNWTQKIDTKKGYLINFLNTAFAQKVRFTYQQGDDFLCQKFQDANMGRAYGFYEWQNLYQLGEAEQEIAVPIFASTIGNYTIRNANERAGGGRYMPQLWAADYSNPDNTTQFELSTAYTPRVLKYRYTVGAHPITMAINYDAGASQYFTNQIFDAYFDLTTPPINAFPIAVDVADSLRFDASTPNHLGLFEQYYKQQFRSISDARYVTLRALLNEKDINGLDFRKPIKIQNSYFYLQAFEDWIAGENETCKIVLIEIT